MSAPPIPPYQPLPISTTPLAAPGFYPLPNNPAPIGPSWSPPRGPDYPLRRLLDNRPVSSRPRVLRSSSKWSTQASTRGLSGLPAAGSQQSEAANLIAARGLQNEQSVCYRNASLQLLLNNPTFMTWLGKHQFCNTPDCLICSFKDLGARYHNSAPQDDKMVALTLNHRLTLFWDLCQKVFWGSRAQRKRKIGPEHGRAGGSETSFLFWLLTVMREQIQHIPS